MAIKRRSLLAGGAAFWAGFPAILQAQAASDTVVSHGFATHGDLKYPADARNLEYANPDAPKGGLVRLAGRGTFDSLNPFILKGTPAGAVGQIYETLMFSTNDEAATSYGLIAETIETPKDRSWAIFTLRPQARWHDGKPITADDVVFSFDILKSKGAPQYAAYWQDVAKAEKLDERVVKFTFRGGENNELPSIIGQLFNGVDSEALLAIPFFLLVGELMSSANVVQRVINLSLTLVGHLKGGLSQVVAVFSMFFSEMSGSTTADAAVMSRTLGVSMRKEGYDPPFIAAIIAAASTIAALVPPSITAVVYGAVGNVSIAGLFMAGFLPGFMIGIGLMIYCYFFGPEGIRRPRATFGQFTDATKQAALPLMIPVILLGGILTGWFTPTEAGVVAVCWILFVVIPFLNPRHIRNLPHDFCQAGLIYSLPLITIAAATAFGWMLAYLRGAIVISDWITAMAGNDPHLIMLLLVLLFTIVGDFIEPVPTIIIFMPLVNSLTEAGSINPVHMGVVLIVTLAFGLITPPYGLVLLMASKFVGVPFSKALKAALPIYVVFLTTIVFTIFVPSAILWLPKHVMPEAVGCFKNPSGSGYICPS